MECDCIRAAEVPRATRLFASYLEKFPDVSQFFAYPPTFEAVRQSAGEARLDAASRAEVCAVLREQNKAFGSDASVERSLDRLANGAVAIVAGQQTGLFTGPSYTIYKALTALRLAADLSDAGTPAVPVFWLASEDHDLAEINHCLWPVRSGAERLELPVALASARRVGEVPLGDAAGELVQRAAGTMEGVGAAAVVEALEQSYTPLETFGSAFGKLMARIFAGRGLILLDPLSPRLHRLTAPVYRAALEQHGELGLELLARGKAIERAGYHVQVKVTESSTLLFVNLDGERLPLRARNGEFLLGKRTFSATELTALLESAPEDFSPNVLLRPLIQDTLLPTAAYVAGPAEIAYFAQASVVYQRLLRRMPVIFPRASVTLVDKRLGQLLAKYKLTFAEVLRGRAHVRGKMEQGLLPKSLTGKFEKGEKALRKILQYLREPIAELDATLGGALDTAERKMLYQFAKTRGKAGRAMAFRSKVIDGHERELLGHLYPQGELQERSLCFLPLLASQGMELLDEVQQRITLGGTQHQVLYL